MSTMFERICVNRKNAVPARPRVVIAQRQAAGMIGRALDTLVAQTAVVGQRALHTWEPADSRWLK